MFSLHLDVTQDPDDVHDQDNDDLDPSATFDDDFQATEEFDDLDDLDDPFAVPKSIQADPFHDAPKEVHNEEHKSSEVDLYGGSVASVAKADTENESKTEPEMNDSNELLTNDNDQKEATGEVLPESSPVTDVVMRDTSPVEAEEKESSHQSGETNPQAQSSSFSSLAMHFESDSTESGGDNIDDEELQMAKLIRRERRKAEKRQQHLASQPVPEKGTTEENLEAEPPMDESHVEESERASSHDNGPRQSKAMADLFGKFKFGKSTTTRKVSPVKKMAAKLTTKPVINPMKSDPNLQIVFDFDEDAKPQKPKPQPKQHRSMFNQNDMLLTCTDAVKTRRARFKKNLVKGVDAKRKKLQKKYRREFGKEEDYCVNDFGRVEDSPQKRSEREKRQQSMMWDDEENMDTGNQGDDEEDQGQDEDGDVQMGELELKLELDESQSMSNSMLMSIPEDGDASTSLSKSDEASKSPDKPPVREPARDIEEVDLSELLKKDRNEWDAEDHALYNLVYGDRQTTVPDEIKKYFDVEASDEDDEGNPIPKSKDAAFEEQFGIVKGLISMDKNVELASDKVDRAALHKQMMEQEDAAREDMIQRAFIDGEWRKMRRATGMIDEDDDFDAANPMNMVGRDAELGQRPEDFLCEDEEKNKDCYDEYGNFLPVWQIKMNRYRRRVNSMNFALSDEEDVTPQELQRRKELAIKRKFKRQMSNSQLDEDEDLDDEQRDFWKRMRRKKRTLTRSASSLPATSRTKDKSTTQKKSSGVKNFASFNKGLPNAGKLKVDGVPALHSQSSFADTFGEQCRILNESGNSNQDSQASGFVPKRFVFSVDQSRSRTSQQSKRSLKRSHSEPDQGGRESKRRRLNE